MMLSEFFGRLRNKWKWKYSKKSELNFWDSYFRTEGLQWKDNYKLRFNPDFPLQDRPGELLPLHKEEVVVLDVGAGPMTYLGKKHPNKKLLITAVDPLAEEYDKILEKYDITPLVKTEKLDAEKLTERFSENSFDLVFARNCIDHSYDPEEAILQMIKVVKKGCYVLMEHRENEAINENYRGFHQWNFSLAEDGNFLISSKKTKVNFSKKYKEICNVDCELDTVEDWLITRIIKL